MKISNIARYRDIMKDLRKLPETSKDINAYCGDEYDVLLSFYEAIYEDELYEDDIANAFIQLYSIDFQSKHEGIDTFYENFYEDNKRNDVLRACQWLNQNEFKLLSGIIQAGYENSEKEGEASEWIYNNPKVIYSAYRKIMFEFEAKYLKNVELI